MTPQDQLWIVIGLLGVIIGMIGYGIHHFGLPVRVHWLYNIVSRLRGSHGETAGNKANGSEQAQKRSAAS